MKLVIADTGPINYLILIGEIHLLPLLFSQIVLPVVVQAELSAAKAPPQVRNWIAHPPEWLQIQRTQEILQNVPHRVHTGEWAAIVLALELGAELLLMDDRAGVTTAEARGLTVTGTLGILDLAANRGLVEFVKAVERLGQTTFRMPKAVLDRLVTKHQPKSL